MRQEILIVDPFPGIWRHSSMLSSIASHLVDIGFNVTVLNCDSKAQKFCSYYFFRNKSSSFSISQSDCCKECLARNEGRKVVLLSDALEFKNLNLYDDLPRELLDLNQDKSFSEWTWRDLPVGRYCAYDMGLEFKTNPAEAITRNQSRFVSDLKNSIVILESVISFVQNKQPVAVIFHNGLYSANRPSWEWLRERNILALDVRNSTNEKHRDTRYHVTQTLAPIFNNEFGCMNIDGVTGFVAEEFYVIAQKVTTGEYPNPNLWREIDFTSQLSGYTIGGYIDPQGLYQSTFTITSDLYDNASIHDMGSVLYIPTLGSSGGLNFGDEYYFYGNIETDIQATIYEMKYRINLPSGMFVNSSNPSWNNSLTPHFNEIGLYDSDNDLIFISKMQRPTQRSGIQQIMIKYDF